jgi:hypothetical protein
MNARTPAAPFGSMQMLAQQPEQAVGRGTEQERELIGLESMTADPVGFKIDLQLPDPVFRHAQQKNISS